MVNNFKYHIVNIFPKIINFSSTEYVNIIRMLTVSQLKSLMLK